MEWKVLGSGEERNEKWQWFKAWGNMFGHFARELIATNHEREIYTGDSFKNNDHLTSSNLYTAHEKRKLRTILYMPSKVIMVKINNLPLLMYTLYFLLSCSSIYSFLILD